MSEIFIINGKSHADKRQLFEKLNRLRNCKYSVEIKEIRPGRSQAQNNYYWACIIAPLADFFGYDGEEMHEVLKVKFRSEGKILPNGEFLFSGKSTKKMSTKEAEEYYEMIRIWALTSFDFKIMLPNEYDSITSDKNNDVIIA